MSQTSLSGPLSVPTGLLPRAVTVISGDGAISIPENDDLVVFLTKGGAAAITIIPAVAADEGKKITIIAGTAQAHVITQGTVGFNGKGSSGTITWTAAVGNSCTLVAYNSIWHVTAKNGVTVA
jgi:hypothetical protein